MKLVKDFLSVCTNVESKRHMHEILTLLQMSSQKMEGIVQVLSENRFAQAA